MESTHIICLKNNKGYIRKRSETAVLRYYLSYNNDEDLARGLLILFKPFKNEMVEIHQKDVKELLATCEHLITEKSMLFEKYKVMSDLIANIRGDLTNKDVMEQNEEEDLFEDLETTDPIDIDAFNKWAHSQATKDLSTLKQLTDICKPDELRNNISSLNQQQRRPFDDFTECWSWPQQQMQLTL